MPTNEFFYRTNCVINNAYVCITRVSLKYDELFNEQAFLFSPAEGEWKYRLRVKEFHISQ